MLLNVSQMFVYLGENKTFPGVMKTLGLFFFNCEAIWIVFFSFDFIPFSSITPKWGMFSCFELDLKK